MLVEDMSHAFYTCDYNMGAGQTLIEVLRNIMSNISMEKVVRLEFSEVEIMRSEQR